MFLVTKEYKACEQCCDWSLSKGRASSLCPLAETQKILKFTHRSIGLGMQVIQGRNENNLQRSLSGVSGSASSIQHGPGYSNTLVCFHKPVPHSFGAGDRCEETITSWFQRSHRFTGASVVNVRKVSCHKLFPRYSARLGRGRPRQEALVCAIKKIASNKMKASKDQQDAVPGVLSGMLVLLES